jgi:flagellar hook-length control protein FliK
MTRIDTPLAQPAADKPVDKTMGKTSAKDGDGRQAAFRSLLRQLGGQTGAPNGDAGKDAKTAPGDASRAPSPLRHRTPSKEDKTTAASADAVAAMPTAEPTTTSEPALAWQAILGTGERQGPSPIAVDLSALVASRAPETEVPATPSGKPPHATDRTDRQSGVALPSNTALNLALADTASPAPAEGSDPFAALSSLLDRATDTSADPETPDVAPIKMSVVTRETHFEPVARLSPVQQIATAIGDDLATLAEPPKGDVASQPTEPSRHSAGPLKVLHVKLEPEDLGSVVLKMRLVDKSLELEVVASRQETADLLAKDRDMLTRALRGSGYTADVVAITTSTAPDGGQMAGDRSGGQTPSGHAGAQAGDNRNPNNAEGGGQRPSSRPQPMQGAAHEESGAGHSGGDLYL